MAKRKLKNNHKKKHKELWNEEETAAYFGLAYIAGYTSGGVPYGLTLEEMAEIERKENLVIEEIKLDVEEELEEDDLPF
ncbi:MAG: hypothetical protein JXR88_02835 [Clostridia bacterium]|nr:hypothetical protein [Clostridia bacterium]